jgi:hypothetical protein
VVAVDFEAHLTLRDPERAAALLERFVAVRRLRRTTIELPRGAWPVQNMVTWRFSGRPGDAIQRALALGSELAALGIETARIKVEASPLLATEVHADIPPALYIEHHVKVRLEDEALERVRSLGHGHDAHLSRTPRQHRDGVHERFLTQRFAPAAVERAEAGLADLIEALRCASIDVARVERERVIYDSNLRLDAGWLPEVSP